jgi:hypothetical protein
MMPSDQSPLMNKLRGRVVEELVIQRFIANISEGGEIELPHEWLDDVDRVFYQLCEELKAAAIGASMGRHVTKP